MNRKNPPVVLTIAGSDCSGGAGIQADLKTMSAFDVYGMSVITAVTAQNTCGVTGVQNVTGEMIRLQLEAVMSDIMPDAVKMLATADAVEAVADILEKYHVEHVILDPVMVSTSGRSLLEAEGKEQMLRRLFPLAELVTPNIPEAEVLSEMKISNEEEMIKAAEIISEKYGCAVLCKGGHQINDANDLLFKNGTYTWYNGKRINNPNTHGTGCTLSSAIAANLAKGFDLDASVKRAKDYISGALAAMLDLGKGSGPMNHAFAIHGEY